MKRLSRLETIVNCGLKKDPFKQVLFETGDTERLKDLLSVGVDLRGFISIVGDRGIGKTEAVTAALGAMKNVKVVEPESRDHKRLLISDIQQAMVWNLGNERPPKGRELLSRTLRPILGKASTEHNVVLVIEESHLLHSMTIKALKSLMEMKWMGKKELFTIILIGQSDPLERKGLSEVRLRASSIYMTGLTTKEVEGYIQGTVGHMVDEGVPALIAEKTGLNNFLDLQELLLSLLGRKLATGDDVVTEDLVAEELGFAAQPMPESAPKPAPPKAVPKSVKETLKSVMGRHQGAAKVEEKRAVNE